MSDLEPINVVRARFPATVDDHAGPLQEYARDLGTLRARFEAEDVRGIESAVIFHAAGNGLHD